MMRSEYKWIISLVAILIMVIAVTLLVNYIYNEKERECISNPFIFEVKRIEARAGVNLSCSCIFLTHLKAPTIYFNSENVTIENKVE